MHKLSLFIFRRDLRLFDNQGIIKASRESEQVLPLFVFNIEQTGPEKNPYFGEPAFKFLLESLDDLRQQVVSQKGALYFSNQKLKEVLEKAKQTGVDAVYVSEDFTPFARKRDLYLKSLCSELGLDFVQTQDIMLVDPRAVSNKAGEPYKVFTPYFRAASEIAISKPEQYEIKNFASTSIFDEDYSAYTKQPDVQTLMGGRAAGLERLNYIIPNLKEYGTNRDFPAQDQTTKLSPHLKFGTLSPREVYYRAKDDLGLSSKLISELYWREFYTHVGYHFPHVFQGAFRQEYNDLPWENDRQLFEAWKIGKTGFPIVDAGMRQLNESGWMHNRVRMIVASFLVKDLHIDWHWGEQYFAQKLVDYDPMNNNGSWQWAASTGVDSQPYFRIFNPWLQHKRFDPECVYVKEWLPELAHLTPEEIFALEDTEEAIEGYVAKIVDHKERAQRAKDMFKVTQ